MLLQLYHRDQGDPHDIADGNLVPAALVRQTVRDPRGFGSCEYLCLHGGLSYPSAPFFKMSAGTCGELAVHACPHDLLEGRL